MYHINKVKSKFFDFEPILSGPRNVILFTLILSFVKSSWFLHIYGHAKVSQLSPLWFEKYSTNFCSCLFYLVEIGWKSNIF